MCICHETRTVQKIQLLPMQMDYADITTKSIDEYVLWMQNRKKYNATSQKQRISSLSSFMKYASKREMGALSAYNVIAQTQTPKIPRADCTLHWKKSKFCFVCHSVQVNPVAGM